MSLIKIVKELYQDKGMLWRLSKNDVKARFASSYLGTVWAYVQPLATMLVFWFVFQVGLRSSDVSGVPYILWYAPAFLIWTFFQEALVAMTNSIKEYSYLVRKVNFHVSVIPAVKLGSSFFVHLGFIVFLLFLNLCYGRVPNLYNLQVVYYLACTILLLWGLGMLCAAIAPFIGDVSNVVNVVLQILFWATPIVWNPETMSEQVQTILKLNPMFYICRGYRECFVEGVWFWEHRGTNLYFWGITIVLMLLGSYAFNRLRSDFSDVL